MKDYLYTEHTTKNYSIQINPITHYYTLYSYGTPICVIQEPEQSIKFYGYWFEYSATTKRHVHWFFKDVLGAYVSINDIRRCLKDNTNLYGYHVYIGT